MVFGIERKHVIIILLVMSFIFSLCGGTLAYLSWQTSEEQKTEIVFTSEKNFECAADGGGNITAQDVKIRPTTCMDSAHAIKREIKVMPTIYDDNSISMDLWLDINVLDSGLSNSQNFKYALTTSSTSCTDGVVKIGNFNGNIAEDKVSLLNFVNYDQTTEETYYLYIWLDKAETSSMTMNQNFSFSLNGSCTSAPEPQTYIAYDPTDNTLRISKGNEGGGTSPMNNTSNKSNVFMPKYMDNLYNVDKIENDNNYFDLENMIYNGDHGELLPWYEYREDIKRVIVEDEISPKDISNWFEGMINVEYIDVSKINTSRVTNMSFTFSNAGYNVTNFRIVGLDKWNTSNVTTMRSMFYAAGYSTTTFELNLSNWNVSNVANINYLFEKAGYNATTFRLIGLNNWDTSSMISMERVFQFTAQNATTFDIGNLSGWDTSNVTSMAMMFEGAGENATTFNIGDLSNWNVSKVTSMFYMFCAAGRNATNWSLDLSDWNVSLVTAYSSFNYRVESKVTAPTWLN